MSTRQLRIEPYTEPDDGSEYGILDVDDDDSEVAEVSGGKDLALLFAAAPELAEVIREAFDARGCERVNHDGSRVLRRAWVERARAALAKAGGRS